MPACVLGCRCGKHQRNTAFELIRQQQLATQLSADDELNSKQLHRRQQQRRYRKHYHESSVNGGGNHMATPSETFDWDRAIAGFRQIMSERYDDE